MKFAKIGEMHHGHHILQAKEENHPAYYQQHPKESDQPAHK